MSATPQPAGLHSENTMDPFVSASAAVSIQRLEKRYFAGYDDAKKLEVIKACVSEFGQRIRWTILVAATLIQKRQQFLKQRELDYYRRLLPHWKDLQSKFNEALGLFDRIGETDYPLKKVFTLVYLASKDLDAAVYEDVSDRVVRQRFETFVNAIITLHREDTRCHQGIRNDLVGTLSGVHPDVKFLPPRIFLQRQTVADYVTGHLAEWDIEKRRQCYINWMRAGEMPAELAAELREERRLSNYLRQQEAMFKAAGLTPKNGINPELLASFMQNLKLMIEDDDCFLHCDYVLVRDESFKYLQDFYHPKFQLGAPIQKVHDLIDAWIVEYWQPGEKCRLITDYLVVRTTDLMLRRNKSALICWNADVLPIEQIEKTSAICTSYVAKTRVEDLVITAKQHRQFIQFHRALLVYKKDSRFDLIENFFARFFASDAFARLQLQRTLLNKQFRKQVLVDGRIIDSWQIESSSGQRVLDLTPGRINRLLLTAILTPHECWPLVVADSVRQVIDFIGRGFDRGSDANAMGLKVSSYPGPFMDLIRYQHACSQVTADSLHTVEKPPFLVNTCFFEVLVLVGKRLDLIGNVSNLSNLVRITNGWPECDTFYDEVIEHFLMKPFLPDLTSDQAMVIREVVKRKWFDKPLDRVSQEHSSQVESLIRNSGVRSSSLRELNKHVILCFVLCLWGSIESDQALLQGLLTRLGSDLPDYIPDFAALNKVLSFISKRQVALVFKSLERHFPVMKMHVYQIVLLSNKLSKAWRLWLLERMKDRLITLIGSGAVEEIDLLRLFVDDARGRQSVFEAICLQLRTSVDPARWFYTSWKLGAMDLVDLFEELSVIECQYFLDYCIGRKERFSPDLFGLDSVLVELELEKSILVFKHFQWSGFSLDLFLTSKVNKEKRDAFWPFVQDRLSKYLTSIDKLMSFFKRRNIAYAKEAVAVAYGKENCLIAGFQDLKKLYTELDAEQFEIVWRLVKVRLNVISDLEQLCDFFRAVSVEHQYEILRRCRYRLGDIITHVYAFKGVLLCLDVKGCQMAAVALRDQLLDWVLRHDALTMIQNWVCAEKFVAVMQVIFRQDWAGQVFGDGGLQTVFEQLRPDCREQLLPLFIEQASRFIFSFDSLYEFINELSVEDRVGNVLYSFRNDQLRALFTMQDFTCEQLRELLMLLNNSEKVRVLIALGRDGLMRVLSGVAPGALGPLRMQVLSAYCAIRESDTRGKYFNSSWLFRIFQASHTQKYQAVEQYRRHGVFDRATRRFASKGLLGQLVKATEYNAFSTASRHLVGRPKV